jgi:hypothetical protein
MSTPLNTQREKGLADSQFGVGTLFGVILLVGCILSGLRIGISSTLALCVPLGILGFQILASRAFATRTPVKSWAPTALCTLLALLTALIATPNDSKTWICLFGGAAWSLVFVAIRRGKARKLFMIPIGVQVLLLLCCLLPGCIPFLEVASIQDVRGGRTGIKVVGLRFRTSEQNTALLEEYLGPLEPQWEHQSLISPPARDGNERVNSRSIIRDVELPAILAMLPDHAARRLVLKCLTDPRNKLRVHQGMLLVALYTLDYPPGYNARSWWKQHSHLFCVEDYPYRAVKVIWGWRHRIEESTPIHGEEQDQQRYRGIWRQCQAADYQERGSWGGDSGVGEAFVRLERTIRKLPNLEDNLPVHGIAWWPKASR